MAVNVVDTESGGCLDSTVPDDTGNSGRKPTAAGDNTGRAPIPPAQQVLR